MEHYYPKSQRISAQLAKELAETFEEKDNKVYIIVPDANSKIPYEIKNIHGISVVFFRSPETKVESRILRAINELILSITAFFMLSKLLKNIKPDYVVYFSPTIFFGAYIKYLVKKFNIKSYLVLRDIFPQWTVDVGLIQDDGLIHRFFKYFERLNYSAANYIGLEAPSILKDFCTKNTDHAFKTELLFNWVSTKDKNVKKVFSLRDKFSLQDKIIFFYGGNIGVAQDVGNIIRLADALRNQDNIVFVVMGHGTERKKISDEIADKNLERKVVFTDGVPQEVFSDYIQEIDIGLMSLNKNNTGHNIPGKLLNYSKNGIPILGSVNRGNDIINIINNNNAGIVVENGDDKAFKKAAESLLDKKVRDEKSIGSKSLVERIFNVDVAAEKILIKNK